MFENEFFPTTVVQHRQDVDEEGRRTFFSGLINIFVFAIL